MSRRLRGQALRSAETESLDSPWRFLTPPGKPCFVPPGAQGAAGGARLRTGRSPNSAAGRLGSQKPCLPCTVCIILRLERGPVTGSWVLGFPWDAGIGPQEADPMHIHLQGVRFTCGGSSGLGSSSSCHFYGLEEGTQRFWASVSLFVKWGR